MDFGYGNNYPAVTTIIFFLFSDIYVGGRTILAAVGIRPLLCGISLLLIFHDIFVFQFTDFEAC